MITPFCSSKLYAANNTHKQCLWIQQEPILYADTTNQTEGKKLLLNFSSQDLGILML